LLARADGRRVELGRARHATPSAILRIVCRVDTSATAFDARQYARKIARPGVANRRRMVGCHTHGAAFTTVGRAAQPIHARTVAVERRPRTGEAAHAARANLEQATGAWTTAAMSAVGLQVDALAITIRVTEATGKLAAIRPAHGRAVGSRLALHPARPTVDDVVELHALAVAQAEAVRAGNIARGVVAHGGAVGDVRAGFAAFAAVRGVCGQVATHAAAARVRALGSVTLAGAVACALAAQLARGARFVATSAMGAAQRSVDASATARCKTDVAAEAALAVDTGRHAAGRRVAHRPASAAVLDVRLDVGAGGAAKLEALVTSQTALPCAAGRAAVRRHWAGHAARAAVERAHLGVHARAVTVLAPTRTAHATLRQIAGHRQ